MQVLLVHTPGGTQGGMKRRPRSLTGVAMNFTSAIAIIILHPFVYTRADGGMGWMTALAALPFVGIRLRAASRNVFGDEGTASLRVRVVAHPKALLARVARDNAHEPLPCY